MFHSNVAVVGPLALLAQLRAEVGHHALREPGDRVPALLVRRPRLRREAGNWVKGTFSGEIA